MLTVTLDQKLYLYGTAVTYSPSPPAPPSVQLDDLEVLLHEAAAPSVRRLSCGRVGEAGGGSCSRTDSSKYKLTVMTSIYVRWYQIFVFFSHFYSLTFYLYCSICLSISHSVPVHRGWIKCTHEPFGLKILSYFI